MKKINLLLNTRLRIRRNSINLLSSCLALVFVFTISNAGMTQDCGTPVINDCPPNLNFDITSPDECTIVGDWADPVDVSDDCNGNGFESSFIPTSWTLSNTNGGGSNSTVDDSNAPTSILITGTTDGTAGQITTTTYCINVPSEGDLSFDWSAIVLASGIFTNDECGYSINGGETLLGFGAVNSNSGSVGPLSLNANDEFCFVVKSNNQFGLTSFTASNFKFNQIDIVQISGPAPSDPISVGTYTVIYEATNSSGASSQCSFDVTVTDIAPTLECPNDYNVSILSSITCDTTLYFELPSVIDNCPAILDPIQISGPRPDSASGAGDGDIVGPGEYTIEYEYTDAGGQTASCDFTVTVIDASNIAPTFTTCPLDITLTVSDPSHCDTTAYWFVPTATDNCNEIGFQGSFTPFAWSFDLVEGDGTDGFVDETNAPAFISITGSGDGTNDVNTNSLYCITINGDGILAFDWEATIPNPPGLLNNDEPGYFLDGTEVILATGPISDANGSVELPVSIGQEFCFMVKSNNRGQETTLNISNLTFDQVIITQTSGPVADSAEGAADGEAIPTGTHLVEYTATDRAGNTAVCSFNLNIVDRINPEFSDCPATLNIQLDPLECERNVDFTLPTATDLCNNGGFQNNFDPINWELTFEGSNGTDGSVDLNNVPYSATIVGSDNGTNNTFTNTKYCIEIEGDGSIDFDWLATIMNPPGLLNNDEPAYSLNGTETILATGPISEANGSVSLAVADGDEFCFIVRSNNRGEMTSLKIDNFVQNTILIEQTDNTGYTSGSSFPIGNYILMYEATDAAGNTSMCEVEINILEHQTDAVLCRKELNYSLDELDCEGSLTPEMLLTGDDYGCLALCEITVTNEYGDEVPNLFTSDDIGKTFDYMICCGGNCCWGKVLIEDKVAPTLSYKNEEISCVEGIESAPIPTIVDNCGGTVELVNQTYEPYLCNEFYTGFYRRYFQATDLYGNKSGIVEQIVNLTRVDVNRAIVPNSSGLNRISCSQVPFDQDVPVDLLGVPTLDGMEIYPLLEGVICNGYVDYNDELVSQSPCSKIIKRTWEIGEWWCSTTIRKVVVQMIEISDDTDPIFLSPLQNMEVSTDTYSCEASVTLPFANVDGTCSAIKSVRANWDGPAGTGFIPTNGGPAMFPAGVHIVIYTATDLCDNTSTASMTVTVKDQADPIAICNQSTIASIIGYVDPNGTTFVDAKDIDNGSFDECGPVTLEIRKMEDPCGNGGTEWAERVYFCCEEVNTTVMVALRVTDMSLNTNMCMVAVVPQDKIVSTMSVPGELIFECDFAYDPDSLSNYFGAPVVSGGGCTDLSSVVETVENNTNSCGIGHLVRTFTLNQPNSGTITKTQVIWFVNSNPFTEANGIVWPGDFNEPNICMGDTIPPSMSGEPIITEGRCDQVGYTYDDRAFQYGNGSCVQYIRRWTVIDWCQKENGQFRKWTHDQNITVNNTGKPEFTFIPLDSVFLNHDIDCGPLTLNNVMAARSRDTDNCTDSLELLRRFQLYNWNNTADETDDFLVDSGNGHGISGTFPNGYYRVEYFAEDRCGNFEIAEAHFQILNAKSPVAYCMQGLSTQLEGVDLDPNQEGAEAEEVVINAEMFNNGSEHSCDYELTYSFSADVNDNTRTFTCEHIGRQNLEMWVTDINGNTSFCTTFIDVVDSNDVDICVPRLAQIEGRIATENDDIVAETMVTLENSELTDAMTDENGYYTFPEMAVGGTYAVNPHKDGDDLNGVSTLDVVMIQRHILGLTILESPFKLIAADINKDDKISASDLVQLRKVILGITSGFPDNTSWRFVDKTFEFYDVQDPFLGPIQEQYIIDYFDDNMSVDFVGVKVGDVNGSVNPGMKKSDVDENRNQSTVSLLFDDLSIKATNTYMVPIYTEDFIDVAGFQYTLELKGLQFSGIQSGAIDLNVDNLGFSNNMDLINVSWNTQELLSVDEDEPLFTLVLLAKENGDLSEMININQKGLSAEIYQSEELNINSIIFERRNSITENNVFMMYQNSPNPFKAMSEIEFTLPNDGTVNFTIYDVTGKELMNRSIEGNKGFNYLMIDKNEINTTGVVYYKMTYNNKSLIKKMIIIE